MGPSATAAAVRANKTPADWRAQGVQIRATHGHPLGCHAQAEIERPLRRKNPRAAAADREAEGREHSGTGLGSGSGES
jgi:hypothetical protein